jgi:hypothetical protein
MTIFIGATMEYSVTGNTTLTKEVLIAAGGVAVNGTTYLLNHTGVFVNASSYLLNQSSYLLNQSGVTRKFTEYRDYYIDYFGNVLFKTVVVAAGVSTTLIILDYGLKRRKIK